MASAILNQDKTLITKRTDFDSAFKLSATLWPPEINWWISETATMDFPSFEIQYLRVIRFWNIPKLPIPSPVNLSKWSMYGWSYVSREPVTTELATRALNYCFSRIGRSMFLYDNICYCCNRYFVSRSVENSMKALDTTMITTRS